MSGAARPGVAVTGAGGFIGQRLADMLEGSGAEVRRLKRRSLRLDDAARLAAAVSGCEALVHCAFDAYDEAANLRIAETIGHVCAASGTRLVHLSTAAVYEPLPDGIMTEDASTEAPGTAYKTAKRAIDQLLLGLVATRGLDLVILRPTIVYGPAGGAWTDGPIRELLTGDVWLPDAGRGLCNAVHVDDVCQAAMAACDAHLASGEVLLVSGPGPVTWRAFLGAYQAMLGTDSLRLEEPGRSTTIIATDSPRSGRKRYVQRKLLGHLGAPGRAQLIFLLQRLRLRLRGRAVFRAGGAKRALYEARCDVSTAKAERLLGFRPRFNLASGMAATQGYVQHTYGSARCQRTSVAAPRITSSVPKAPPGLTAATNGRQEHPGQNSLLPLHAPVPRQHMLVVDDQDRHR